MMGWQWHQLDHMQIICILFQTDSHASTSSLLSTGWMLFLTPNHQRQSTEGKRETIDDCKNILLRLKTVQDSGTVITEC